MNLLEGRAPCRRKRKFYGNIFTDICQEDKTENPGESSASARKLAESVKQCSVSSSIDDNDDFYYCFCYFEILNAMTMLNCAITINLEWRNGPYYWLSIVIAVAGNLNLTHPNNWN